MDSVSDKYSLVIFDLDGTLVNAFNDITAAVNYALGKLNLPMVETPFVRKYVGSGVRALMKDVLRELHALNGSEKKLDRAVSLWKEYSLEHPADQAELYPGVKSALERLSHKGVRIAVVSNKLDEVTGKVLEHLDISEMFDEIRGERPEFPKKPAPDALLHIMKRFDSSPEETLMVGDGRADIAAGKAANCDVWGVSWGILSPEEFRELGIEKVIDSMEEFVV